MICLKIKTLFKDVQKLVLYVVSIGLWQAAHVKMIVEHNSLL